MQSTEFKYPYVFLSALGPNSLSTFVAARSWLRGAGTGAPCGLLPSCWRLQRGGRCEVAKVAAQHPLARPPCLMLLCFRPRWVLKVLLLRRRASLWALPS